MRATFTHREGELADDITVEHEEFVCCLEDVTGESNRSSGSERDIFLGDGDLDVVLLLNVLEEVKHSLRLVVDCEDDLIDASLGEVEGTK